MELGPHGPLGHLLADGVPQGAEIVCADAEGDRLVVDMTMTTPGCPASEVLPEMARAAIADAAEGAVSVEVRAVWDPPWSPAMIDEDAARALGFRAR